MRNVPPTIRIMPSVEVSGVGWDSIVMSNSLPSPCNAPSFFSLSREIYSHLRRHVFDGLASYVYQRFLHRAGERKWRLVFHVHDRRSGIRANTNASRESE